VKVEDLKAKYDESHRAYYQSQLNTFLETEIKAENSEEIIKPKESDFKFEADDATHRFKELYTIFLEKKKEYKRALAQKEEDNFKAKSDVISEIERYIVMPGQACAYKVGMMKILELRAKAKAELGDKFDIRDYHDVVLQNGAVPLDILEIFVDKYIAETL
ncbi:MAG: DUF885 family protein, partial [Kangiellaceae bacterium]|nr:DUF885 family protein [Kangiellaceae bacterium]